jgi:hypothetical protein
VVVISTPSNDKSASHGGAPIRGVRTLLLGTALVVLLCAFTLDSNLRFGRYITAASLPNGAVFLFVVALCGNALVRRLRPRAALNVAELAILFSMLYVSAALPQASVAETLVTLAAPPPAAAAKLGNFEWQIPSWLQVQNPAAVRLFWRGLRTTGGAIPWSAWIVPLLGWSVFVALLLFSLYCLSRAFAHRWIREERVTFPLMELPLELLRSHDSPTPLWRSPLLYLGAVIPATMIVLGELHGYYPAMPEWQQILSFRTGEAWTDPPLNVLSDFTISVWPLVVGISYMLNGEVAVSIWLFHLLFQLQLLIWALAGYSPRVQSGALAFNSLDWIHSTEFGAAVVLSASLLLSVRREVARAAVTLFRRRDEELLVPPWAVAGFALANAGMLAWARAAGANALIGAAFLLCLYAIVIALARLVAAGGLYLVDNGATPQGLVYGLAGARTLAPGSQFVLAGQEALFGRADMSFLYFATNDSKLAAETGTENRWHSAGAVLSVAAALLSAYVFLIAWGYRYGAATFRAWPLNGMLTNVLDRTAGFATAAHGPNPWTYFGIAAGMLIGGFLLFMNRRFLWWAVSPFGFVVASSENITGQIWSSVFLGWLIAALVRRWGGLRAYRVLRPFFLGLILGDAVTFCSVVVMECVVGVRSGR